MKENTMDMKSIPVIDIERLDNPTTMDALDVACRDWGFFQVTRHGIDTETIAALSDAMRAFFSQSTTIKREVSRTADNPWGYFDRELTKNTRDWKQIYDFGPADDHAIKPQWPRLLPEFEPAIRNFYDDCERLAYRLLSAISANLGMPKNYLERAFEPDHTSFLRLNYYPVCPEPSSPDAVRVPEQGHLGINHHTDAGALTLLLQDEQPGLEVFRDGRWHLVQPRSDALVINVGDIVQVWSNDYYRASLHRVVTSSTAERFSAPFFFNPSYGTHYEPLPTTIKSNYPARYREINWGEFRALRAAGDYTDHGEEVQISHYAR
jgi:isopenicillin N synthase-like dioxygenase